MNNTSNVLGDITLQTFLIFIVVGCVLSLLVGIWMLLQPDAALRLNQFFNRWFATNKLASMLVSRRNVENVLHRHHRLVGALVLIGSMYYLIYALLFALKTKGFAGLLFQSSTGPLAGWPMTAVMIVLALGNVLAVVVGVGLLLRPNLLARLEAWASRSYGTEKLQQSLEAMHMQPDEAIARHIRLVGVLIVAGSIYAIASFWIVL